VTFQLRVPFRNYLTYLLLIVNLAVGSRYFLPDPRALWENGTLAGLAVKAGMSLRAKDMHVQCCLLGPCDSEQKKAVHRQQGLPQSIYPLWQVFSI